MEKIIHFLFCCPLRQYEFQRPDGNFLIADTLYNIGHSHATDDILIETYSDIEFIQQRDSRLAVSLQCILTADTVTFDEDQRKK